MKLTLSKNKRYFNIALLLVSAAGATPGCYATYFSFDKKWRDLARWFWSNLSPKHDPAKKPILDKVNEAQGIDLEDWYWLNQ